MPERFLLHNVYGWFDRAERGVYVLTEAGRVALQRWPQHKPDLTDVGGCLAHKLEELVDALLCCHSNFILQCNIGILTYLGGDSVFERGGCGSLKKRVKTKDESSRF